MSVLLHLNGAPGVGKSTIAERLVASPTGLAQLRHRHPAQPDRRLEGRLRRGRGAHPAGGPRDDGRPARRGSAASSSRSWSCRTASWPASRRWRRCAACPMCMCSSRRRDEELAMRWQRRNPGIAWTATSQQVLRELGGTDAVLMAGGLARELAIVDRAVFVRSERHRIDEAVAADRQPAALAWSHAAGRGHRRSLSRLCGVRRWRLGLLRGLGPRGGRGRGDPRLAGRAAAAQAAARTSSSRRRGGTARGAERLRRAEAHAPRDEAAVKATIRAARHPDQRGRPARHPDAGVRADLAESGR